MGKLEKYPSYKDSGVEWLGEIPTEWEALANKHIFKIKQNLVGKNSKDYDLLSLTLKGIIKRDMDNPKGKFPTDFDTYQEVKKDDFVFCLFDVEETPRTVGLSKYDGMITGAYTVMQVNSINNKYLYYFYLNLDSSKRFKPLYKGLRNTIPKDSFFSFKTFIPPKQEQTKIASFLDIKTEQLDIAIKQKEELIELLKERRQILINDVVTKGIDKTVAMKDSGVEWVGSIPEHWEVKKLRYIGNTQNGISAGAEYFGSGFPFINYGDVYKNIELPKVVSGLANSSKEDRNTYSILKGDVFFTRTSETAIEIGFSSTCTETFNDAIFSGFLIRFRPNKKLYEGYSKFYFRSSIHRAYFVKEMNLVIRASLSQELLKNLPVILPPRDEQIKISNYIEKNNCKIDKAINLQQQQITKLKEYKTTLIDSVVTGKVRVCDD